MPRPTIAILSTENLIHNISMIKSWAPNSYIMAMTKANAYGHGLRSVSKRFDGNVYSIGVASIDEAMALRESGVRNKITLIEGVCCQDDLLIASCQNFQVVFHELDQIKWLENIYLPKKLEIWVKVDTGMGRLGFRPEEANKIIKILTKHESVAQPVNVMSHLACADVKSEKMNASQYKNFCMLESIGMRSINNSAGIINFPEHNYEIVRPGLALYGISPINSVNSKSLGLKPVMTLKTRIISIKQHERGDAIGYGARYVCEKTTKIAVAAIGYGDGYSRSIRDGAPVLVNNTRCYIAGRVSMDMITIDVTNLQHVAIGDNVTLWGEGLPIEELVAYSRCSTYDLVTSVQNRVPFYWTI